MPKEKKYKESKKVNRSAADGKFTNKEFSKANPRETYADTVNLKPRPVVVHTPNAPIEPPPLAEGVPQTTDAEAEILVRDFDVETRAEDPDSLVNEK